MVVRRGPPDALSVSPNAPPAGTCTSLQLVQEKFALPLSQDQSLIEYGRDEFLARTRLGRFAIQVFYKNETRLQQRGRATAVTDEERALVTALYAKYAGSAKLALADINRQDIVVTRQQIADGEAAYAATKRFLHEDELAATEKLAELARQRVRPGMTAAEALAALDDEALYLQVKAIAASVSFLDTDVPA